MSPVVFYLHGFLSSPKSVKAQLTADFVKSNYPELTFEVPQLSNYPGQARDILLKLAEQYQGRPLRFIGSSMGGFLSTFMVERFSGRAVLINPAVKPFELLVDYLGLHVNPYTNEQFCLEHKHMLELKEMDTTRLQHPDNYWALLQTDDEVLDYRQAEEKYAGARLTVEQGGDHSFQGYERFLPDIFEFLLED